MKKIVLAAALAAVCGVASAQSAITVNGQTISAATQKRLMDELAKQGLKDKKQQQSIAQSILVQQTVIAQEARKQKLDKDPAILQLIEDKKSEVYLNALLQKIVTSKPIPEAEIKKAYDEAKKNYDPREAKIRHILVKTEAEAKDLISKIQAGADMAALATEKTLDKGTASNGGLIDFTNVKSFRIPGFTDAALALDKGEVRKTPFQSQLGYHVLKLEDTRETAFPEFNALKEQIRRQLMQRKMQQYVADKVKAAKVEAKK